MSRYDYSTYIIALQKLKAHNQISKVMCGDILPPLCSTTNKENKAKRCHLIEKNDGQTVLDTL